MARKLEVQIVADAKQLERALDRAKGASSQWSRSLQTASRGALIAFGALGVGAAASVKAASDLGEQINKTSVVFGKSAPAIQKWAETTASSIGISNRAALEAAGTFGNMLKPMGVAEPLTAKMSRRFVTLAADMASFNNASPEETLDALRAGLAGETEPLRRFGVFLDAARVKQEALRLGLIKNAKQDLPAAAKAQATYSLILKDTTDAQGDFGRTADSLANQQRTLRAQLEDTAASLGQALLPAATEAAGALSDLVGWVQQNETAAKVLTGTVAAFSAAIILANTSLAIYNAQLVTAIGLSKALRLALAVTPWGAAILGAGLLAEAFLKQDDASTGAADAQRDLTAAVRAYKDATKQSKDASEEYGAAQRRLEQAEINVKRAVLEETRVNKDNKSSLLDRREASLRVSDAYAELRAATDAVGVAGDKWRTKAQQQNVAANNQRVQIHLLARKFEDWKTALGRIDTPLERLKAGIDKNTFAMHTGRQNVERYAAAVERGADKIRGSAPKLARTADAAAALARAWGRVVSLPEAKAFVARFRVITSIEEHRLNTPNHPRGASGGIVTRPTVALIGEGGPEAVIPLNRTPGSSPLRTAAANGRGGGGVPGGLVMILTTREIATFLQNANKDYMRQNGGRPILGTS